MKLNSTLMSTTYFEALRATSQPIRAADLPQSLDHVRRLLDALGSPQHRFRSVVVTGSTGKGTTCLRLADVLSRAGLKVGLYTSPHLHLFRERFAVLDASPNNDIVGAHGGAPPHIISQHEFVETARPVLDAARALDHPFSTFETATAIALSWFAAQQIDIAVLEVGIGGRFDAVNVVHNELAVFTPIEAEHVAMLGGSLESVAWHKAGIIQPGGTAITVPQTPEVMAVLEREARAQGAALEVTDDLIEAVLRRGGSACLQAETRPYTPPHEISLPGRLERLTVSGRSVIIDGGHTPAAARFLRDFIGAAESTRLIASLQTSGFSRRFIVGMLRDKDAAAYLRVFDAPNVHFVYTRAPGDRALTPEELLARCQPAQASVTLAPSLDEALSGVHNADESLCVVAGSLRMAAAAREAFGLLSADDLDEARRTRAIFEGEAYQKKLNES